MPDDPTEAAPRAARRAFTDGELAAILEAPPEEPTAALARRLGRDRGAVGNARRALPGGSCPVAWEPCAVCGGSVAPRPGGARPVHLRCQRARRRAYLAARYRADPEAQRAATRRWRERDPDGVAAMRRRGAQRKKARRPEAFADGLDRLEAHAAAEQERTALHAPLGRVRWTAEEDAFVLATLDRPLAEAALALGRTWHATSKRRTLLRRRAADGGR